MEQSPGDHSPEQIKHLRTRLGLTQMALAQALGVSFPTVNRWENGKATPSQLSWNQLLKLAGAFASAPVSEPELRPAGDARPLLDFTAPPEVIRALVEGERLSFGHLVNPA